MKTCLMLVLSCPSLIMKSLPDKGGLILVSSEAGSIERGQMIMMMLMVVAMLLLYEGGKEGVQYSSVTTLPPPPCHWCG